jgi:hypothetical protein
MVHVSIIESTTKTNTRKSKVKRNIDILCIALNASKPFKPLLSYLLIQDKLLTITVFMLNFLPYKPTGPAFCVFFLHSGLT